MKVWLPYVRAGSGADVYTRLLAGALRAAGATVVVSSFDHKWQYFPWRLKFAEPPAGTDAIIANSWNAFAFARKGAKLVTVEHHCVFDKSYAPYRTTMQSLFHESLVRRFELASFRAANAIVTVSRYTANSLQQSLGIEGSHVILNGIDVDFFTPRTVSNAFEFETREDRPFQLLFVGNPSARKGSDLLPKIMLSLGDGFELAYTAGLRNSALFQSIPNSVALGRLDDEGLRDAYRNADVLIFPSRLEGFGYAAAEALACGTPVVASRTSSLPEVVTEDVCGILCPVDDDRAFSAAVRRLSESNRLKAEFGKSGRRRAEDNFSLNRMANEYLECIG